MKKETEFELRATIMQLKNEIGKLKCTNHNLIQKETIDWEAKYHKRGEEIGELQRNLARISHSYEYYKNKYTHLREENTNLLEENIILERKLTNILINK